MRKIPSAEPSITNLEINHVSKAIKIGWGNKMNYYIDEFKQFIKDEEYKFSSGFEARINGFSFYSYPTAIEYSVHIPWFEDNYILKQYLKILFNF